LSVPVPRCLFVLISGKGSYNKPGNKRFREIVKHYIPEYVGARTKFDKSTVLQKIIDIVREQNNGTARFIKQNKDGTWFEISDDAAREKVGHTLRESIAAKDAAPAKAKAEKVVQKKQGALLAQQQAIFDDMQTQDETSSRSTTPIPLSSFATTASHIPSGPPLPAPAAPASSMLLQAATADIYYRQQSVQAPAPAPAPASLPSDQQWHDALELDDLDSTAFV